MKIIIAGGSGSIGTYLADYFAAKGHLVIILSRKEYPAGEHIRYVVWDAIKQGPWTKEINGADVLINLAGKSVNCRYTEKNKRAILNSRIFATQALGNAVLLASLPPKIFFNAASATVYRHAEDGPQDEFSGETGSDFSMNVCKAWERCFTEYTFPQTRKVILRMAITLGIEGGVINRFKNLVRFGLGGKMYNGKQMMSWVHAEDIARSIEFISSHTHENGIFNIASPNPVDNANFMKALRKNMGVPFGIRTPKCLLALGAWLIGTEIELVIKSRWVVPSKLQRAGFRFKYEIIEDSLN